MREIKFRAWQKKHKKMSLTPMIEWENGKIKYIRFDNGVNCAPRFSTYGFKDWDLENIELMQFTGLTDKNGKEIYEGDIVVTNNYCGKTLFLIQYENDYCGSMGSFVAKHLKSFDKKNASTSSVHCGVSESCEIIGNIYENPDLL